MVKIKTVFKNISVNIVNVSLLLIIRLSIVVPDIKGNTLLVQFAVKQLFYTMTILITQTSVVVIKNATILSEYLNSLILNHLLLN